MIKISCAFATSLATPDHVVVAEELGYHRAWLYDSPALYPDVWAMLALAAERTSRIGLGPGVLIPSLRHPMTNAAAIATLEHLAPGRLAVAIGSGFTGRMTMGQRPLSWKFVRKYVETVQALLRGEKVEWDGKLIQMMHPEGFAPARPIEVPLILGVGGPKGISAAEDLADGVFSPSAVRQAPGRNSVILSFGTVLGEGESAGSERVLAAAGHGAAVSLHAMFERGADFGAIPGGAEWAAEIAVLPEEERHLAVHDRHLIALTERDAKVVNGAMLERFGLARTPEGWRQRLAQVEAAGVTEIAYQPAGPDIPGELERFMAAVG
ncbi:MAG: LLM class flavin-dependent oxidoreductase [Dehalococcoidia bacterium]